ncbi:MAG: 3'-5' exonuclease [Myxococcota bacterium]|nr:3'-5' exonuclease [Myxococcota bacterium]MDW8362873.1 3'-5' exonuclease [Myxococcales bacterium]
MRTNEACGCFPTGRHYPGIADRLARAALTVSGLASEVAPSAPWVSAPLAMIDFETTGLDPERDRILEVGIAVAEGGVVVERRGWLVQPGIPVPEQARAVHGITDEELARAPELEQVLPDIERMLAGRLPCAYNAPFDRAFLHAELRRTGYTPGPVVPPAFRPEVHWIDPLVWARELQRNERGFRLVDVCERLGVALRTAHRAAGDAEAALEVLLRLAPQMPRAYGELVRIQARYEALQDADAALRGRRG